MLWVDKHRPQSLSELTYHDGITTRLESLAKSCELPHMLFYGPPGAGKRTRVSALLAAIYGTGVHKVNGRRAPFLWENQRKR